MNLRHATSEWTVKSTITRLCKLTTECVPFHCNVVNGIIAASTESLCKRVVLNLQLSYLLKGENCYLKCD